ncbi:MAG: flippase-like domain-containing protein, partial [Melioribacteraceae bacterium]
TINISALLSSYIYSFATIVGSLSMLPGGLGATEGSLTFLLSNNGFEKEIAVVATLIIRLVTLWFAEFLGAIALLIFSKKEMLNITNINSSVD